MSVDLINLIDGGYDLSERIARAEKVPVLGAFASVGGLVLNAVMAVHGLVMSILKAILPFKFFRGWVGRSFCYHTGEFFNRILNIALLGMPRALGCRGPFPKVHVYISTSMDDLSKAEIELLNLTPEQYEKILEKNRNFFFKQDFGKQ